MGRPRRIIKEEEEEGEELLQEKPVELFLTSKETWWVCFMQRRLASGEFCKKNPTKLFLMPRDVQQVFFFYKEDLRWPKQKEKTKRKMKAKKDLENLVEVQQTFPQQHHSIRKKMKARSYLLKKLLPFGIEC